MANKTLSAVIPAVASAAIAAVGYWLGRSQRTREKSRAQRKLFEGFDERFDKLNDLLNDIPHDSSFSAVDKATQRAI